VIICASFAASVCAGVAFAVVALAAPTNAGKAALVLKVSDLDSPIPSALIA